MYYANDANLYTFWGLDIWMVFASVFWQYLIPKPSGHHLFYSLLGVCRDGAGTHQECVSKYFFKSLWDLWGISNCGTTRMLIYPPGKLT